MFTRGVSGLGESPARKQYNIRNWSTPAFLSIMEIAGQGRACSHCSGPTVTRSDTGIQMDAGLQQQGGRNLADPALHTALTEGV